MWSEGSPLHPQSSKPSAAAAAAALPPSAMGFPQALLALVGAAGLAALILLVLGSIYFEATNSELPAGLEQPARLRVIHACRIGVAVLVRRRAGGSEGGREAGRQAAGRSPCSTGGKASGAGEPLPKSRGAADARKEGRAGRGGAGRGRREDPACALPGPTKPVWSSLGGAS